MVNQGAVLSSSSSDADSSRIVLQGNNFGSEDENAVDWVRYYITSLPKLVWEAEGCVVTKDHEEISCNMQGAVGRRYAIVKG